MVLALQLLGCSFSAYDRLSCESTVDCRDGYGLGAVCGDEGYCEVGDLHPRCTTTYPSDLTLPVDPATTLLVGSVFDHSLETHVGRFQSAQLAAIQANANDGLEGRDFAMIHCNNAADTDLDDLDKDTASVEVAEWLAGTVGVPAIVGPAASSRTEAVYNAVADPFGTLVISPSATSPSLTPLDGLTSTAESPGLLWRTAPPDDLQAVAIARDMRNTFDPEGTTAYRTAPSSNVAVIHQTGAYGDGLNVAFTTAFSDLGGTSQSIPFSDATSRSDAIAQAANGTFDEILFVSSDAQDVIAFLQGAATLPALQDLPLFLTDAARNADVLDTVSGGAQDLLRHVRGTAPATPAGAVNDSFQVSYAAEYGGADVSVLSFTAQSFDAMWLVIYGHAWAVAQEDGVSGLNIARGLRQVSSGDPIEIRPNNWNLVKASFDNGTSVDVTGASGSLDFGPDGETSATIDVWVVQPDNSGFAVVDSVDP